jgi:hypothetical protein
MAGELPHGIYRDRLTGPGAWVVELGWRSNIIVERCRQLLAAFMKGDGVTGVERLRVGRGDPAWDGGPPPAAPASTRDLLDPAAFELTVSPAQIEYLDATGLPTAGPTNRIQVTLALGPGVPPPGPGETAVPLREFGLFGALAGTPFMIDYVRHPVIHKAPADTLTRTIRLVF